MSDKSAPKRPLSKGGQRAPSGGTNRIWWIVSAVAVVIVAALVATVIAKPKSAKKAEPAPTSLVAKVSSVPTSVFADVGAGTAVAAPKAITAPALTVGAKPQVLYVGAEYCPYCATERWPMVIALSRFGSFKGLGTTHSSTTDVFPNTATFSFHGATYTSAYLAFNGVEMETNQRSGDGYTALDKLTPAQQSLFDTYDSPPYTDSAGGIPFIDFGGKYIISGVGYDPTVLQHKSADQIAAALSDPTSAISKGAIGVANTLTAAICSLTHNQPGAICSASIITQIEASLK